MDMFPLDQAAQRPIYPGFKCTGTAKHESGKQILNLEKLQNWKVKENFLNFCVTYKSLNMTENKREVILKMRG